VVTGHQGERGAVLDRMTRGEFAFTKDDVVVFSCSIIPTPSSIAQRAILEKELKKRGVKIITDIHASGHGYSGDIKELISILNPQLLIPSHGEEFMQNSLIKCAKEINFPKENIHCLSVGRSFDVLLNSKE
jgi:ribonuclease J